MRHEIEERLKDIEAKGLEIEEESQKIADKWTEIV